MNSLAYLPDRTSLTSVKSTTWAVGAPVLESQLLGFNMAHYQQINQLVESEYRLATLESPDPNRAVNVFRKMNAATGKAVYDWVPGNGLYRLGAEQIFIPRTATPADLLDYISSSRHYGLYLLREFDLVLGDQGNITRLQKAINPANSVHRLLVLLGVTVHLPSQLRHVAVRVQHNMRRRNPVGA